MIKKFSLFTLMTISLIVMITQSNAFADNRAGTVTLTLGGGYYVFDDRRHVVNTEIPYAAVGFNFTHQWGLEVLYGSFITRFKNEIGDDRQIRGSLFAVDALFHVCPYRNVQPFLLAGVGIVGLNPNRYDANNEGNINAGVGFQWFANETVALRVEARDFYTLINGKNDFFFDAGVTFFLNIC